MSHGRDTSPKPYGVVAEFANGEALLEAAKAAMAAGYRKMEGYSPLPVHGLTEVFEHKDGRLGWAVFGAGVVGACAGFGLEGWVSKFEYAHNVGGKPLFSLPMFIPVAYECTILFAALTAAGAMLALNGLPKPHQPIFNAEAMVRASSDRYILCIESTDANYNPTEIHKFFEGTNALSVETIETSEGY